VKRSVSTHVLRPYTLPMLSKQSSKVRSRQSGQVRLDILRPSPSHAPCRRFLNCAPTLLTRSCQSSPTKSCDLDPIQTFLLKQLVGDLVPFLTVMRNASLIEGHMPLSQRHAIVTPLLKKSSLDPDELKNYRTVYNLTFVSKVV
jgi:hypothetical protein